MAAGINKDAGYVVGFVDRLAYGIDIIGVGRKHICDGFFRDTNRHRGIKRHADRHATFVPIAMEMAFELDELVFAV